MLPIPEREFGRFKDSLKVTVSPHQSRVSDLKVGLRELGFNQKVSKPHVDFSVVLPPIRKRRTRLNPKLRNLCAIATQQRTHTRHARQPRIAEDIHQQRVGTARTIQLLPRPVGPHARSPIPCVNLPQPLRPCRRRADASIRRGMEVAMSSLFIAAEENTRDRSIGAFVQVAMPQRMLQTSGTEFGPQT